MSPGPGQSLKGRKLGIKVNLFQLLGYPPHPLRTRNNGRQQWKKEHLAAVKTHPFPCWSCWLILGHHNNQEWRIVLFIPSHSIIPATSSPNNGVVCVMFSLCHRPSPPQHNGDAVPQGPMRLWASQPLNKSLRGRMLLQKELHEGAD